MVTDLFTVHPEDLIDLAASVMDWEHLRHVPVEDQHGRILGLVTYRRLLRMVGQNRGAKPIAVREIMRTDIVTVTPETPTRKAVELMRDHKVGCLPVVQDGKLVGIITESDLMEVAWKLLDDWLPEE
jgi:CBS domain-containing protein